MQDRITAKVTWSRSNKFPLVPRSLLIDTWKSVRFSIVCNQTLLQRSAHALGTLTTKSRGRNQGRELKQGYQYYCSHFPEPACCAGERFIRQLRTVEISRPEARENFHLTQFVVCVGSSRKGGPSMGNPKCCMLFQEIIMPYVASFLHPRWSW